MRAVVCHELGGPEKLLLQEIDSPSAGPGQVRLSVHAAAFNFLDTLIIRGQYQDRPELPFVPGAEAAGRVLEVGEGVSHIRPGQAVIALCGTGAFAEEVVADAQRVIPIPENLPMPLAASIATAYGTSYYALKEQARLKPGETLLVLGAAGGVGLAAVALGKLMGARVIAAAGSDEKLAAAREAGAVDTINYRSGDLRGRIKELTSGKGVDVIYDPVGAEFAEPCVRSLAWGGRYLVVGFAGGAIPSLPLNLLLLKGASATGVFWGAWVQRNPVGAAASFRELLAWIAEERLKPVIRESYPLAQFEKGFLSLQNRKAVGKVVLTMTDAGQG
ncbi:MAG: NADPH:quinone oxidoreductase family protein [Gammaproteobacteria bacterium]|nr:NADPH:quinone oxidoreductase family protein [Gammaproteobacteria bacterium]